MSFTDSSSDQHPSRLRAERGRRSEREPRTTENRMAAELAEIRELQAISTQLIQEDGTSLYDAILNAAQKLMRSDMATIQLYDPVQDSLTLLSSRGFDPEHTKLFTLVPRGAGTSCAAALRAGIRVVIPDIESSEFVAGTPAHDVLRVCGVGAAQSTPLVSRKGAVIGMITTHWREPYKPSERSLQLIDVLARQAADLIDRGRADDAAQRLAAIVESSDDAIISKELDGTIATWNKGAERLFGYKADEIIGKPVLVLIPEDLQHEEPLILARIRNGERIEHYETVRRRKDGTQFDVSLTVSPVRGPDGKILGASKIARDISHIKRTQTQRELLLQEMEHRIKNLFALASGVVSLSVRSATTPKELAQNVNARLNALAQAHALTLTAPALQKIDRSTMLHELLRTIMAPFDCEGDDGKPRIAIAGADVPVGTETAANFALLLHEFATNAAKYGALSAQSGRLDITSAQSGDKVLLEWRERGGPRITRAIDREGFGSVLARMTVTGQLGGHIERDWQPEGLCIRLTIDRARLSGAPRAG
jgi:PAS domain S-box-containing protein